MRFPMGAKLYHTRPFTSASVTGLEPKQSLLRLATEFLQHKRSSQHVQLTLCHRLRKAGAITPLPYTLITYKFILSFSVMMQKEKQFTLMSHTFLVYFSL